jgi:HlyD family secretion protein
MKKIRDFIRKRWYIVIFLVALFIIMLRVQSNGDEPTWTTATVENGTVSQIISISGSVDADGTAELAFPISGTLASISVTEGDRVTKGQTLASLVQSDVSAEYQDAYGALLIAEADLRELISGLRPEELDVSKTKLQIAEEEFARTKSEHDDLVMNAYRTLLSDDLVPKSEDSGIDAVPPTITGTYTCEPGTYVLSTYRSQAQSGYSYRLSGIESGTFTARTDASSPLGSCGLYIQFDTGLGYGNSEWEITIPNTEGASYTANKNAYDLALTKRANALREAEQNKVLAEQNRTLDTASPRDEARARKEATVIQAQARLARVRADIQDHIISAPFDGVITKVTPVVGEAVGTTPIITITSADAFTLTALVPEIDVTKIHLNQKAEVTFDARPTETLAAHTLFISPLAEEIDGVSYFEAKLVLDTPIDWLRSGLNADVDIIVERQEQVLRIPRRYLIESDNAFAVRVPDGTESKEQPVTVTFMGNDGYVAVEGIAEQSTIIAP